MGHSTCPFIFSTTSFLASFAAGSSDIFGRYGFWSQGKDLSDVHDDSFVVVVDDGHSERDLDEDHAAGRSSRLSSLPGKMAPGNC
jgi:hypothetical protein